MYDFKTLSPYDFEVLTQDLLQKELGVRLEGFKVGRDQGIDLRYLNADGSKLVIQCKHFKGSTFSNLKNALKQEMEKVKLLKPDRYIIVTSLGLTPNNKSEIFEICKPFVKSESDIFSEDDLNNLLRQHSDVVKKHFKLWMTSVEVLETIFNNAIVNRSDFKKEQIKDKIMKFVPNKSLDEARDMLQETNCVVISGIPGIGKTTLADMLIWEYLTDGYEFIFISRDIEDAHSLFNRDPNVKQIFYYDDFLGATNFLNKNEDEDLILFMKGVNRSKNKKMILTTREYILQQAKTISEKMENFDFSKCIIDLKQYTKLIKGKILYNHLYFSDLSQNYIGQIIKNDAYMQIIEHPNYMPRLIEFMTDTGKIERQNILPENYFQYFIDNLNNPQKVWQKAFEEALNDYSRAILLALASTNSSSGFWYYPTGDPKSIAKNICIKMFNKELSDFQYKKELSILEGDFVIVDNQQIKFSNPSIQDFLEYYIQENNLLYKFMEILEISRQFNWFYSTYIQNDKLYNKSLSMALFDKLIDRPLQSIERGYGAYHNVELMIDLALKMRDESLTAKITPFLSYMIQKEFRLYNFERIIDQLTYGLFYGSQNVQLFLDEFKTYCFSAIDNLVDVDDLVVVGNFANSFKEIFRQSELDMLTSMAEEKIGDLAGSYDAIDGFDSSDLENICDRLEECNDLFGTNKYSFDDLIARIGDLQEKEEAEYKISQMSTDRGDYIIKDSSDFTKNEEDEIKELFISLEKI